MWILNKPFGVCVRLYAVDYYDNKTILSWGLGYYNTKNTLRLLFSVYGDDLAGQLVVFRILINQESIENDTI